ncbi:MAG: 30S ribosomal protein S2 [Euryarchaeota archaeon]|nr:30S ribosomal protein S2 [Euryarchaeota archaeon]
MATEVQSDYQFLVPQDDYLAAGVHIGTPQKTKDMKRFIFKVRSDGLFVLNIQHTDEKIRAAAKLLARFTPGKILAVSSRQYGFLPVEKFSQATGAGHIVKRFIPGTLTNPAYARYSEYDILIATDPIGDAQAISEAVNIGIPIIATCHTNNSTQNIDLVIPTNNKGRKALALIYWLLARELLKEKGTPEFPHKVEEFEAQI